MVRTTRSTAKGKNTTATPTRNTRSAGRGKNKNVAAMDEEKPKKKPKKSKEQPTTGKQQPKAGMKVTTSDFYMHAASDFDALVSKKMKAAPKSKRSDGGRVPKGEKEPNAPLETGCAVAKETQKQKKRKPNKAICSSSEGSPISPEEAAVSASMQKSQKTLQEKKKTADLEKKGNDTARVLFPDGLGTSRTASSGKSSRGGIKPTGKKCETPCNATPLTTEDVGRRVCIIFQQAGTTECGVLQSVSSSSSSRWNVKFDDGRIEWVDLGDGDDQNPWRFDERSGSNKSGSTPEDSLKDHYTEAKLKDPASYEVVAPPESSAPPDDVAPLESSAPPDDDGACLESDEDVALTMEITAKASVTSVISDISPAEMSGVKSSTVKSGLSIPPSGCESVPQVSGPREDPKSKDSIAPPTHLPSQFKPTKEPPVSSSSKEPQKPFPGVSGVRQSGTTPAKPPQAETPSDFVCVKGEVYGVQDVPGDGSCLYHALLKGSFPPDISRVLPEDGSALRQVICDFAFNGKFGDEQLDEETQKYLRDKIMVAHVGREVLEDFAKEKKTTVDLSFVEMVIRNEKNENAPAFYGTAFESLMFALLFNVNVTTVSNTLGGYSMSHSESQMEVFKLQEIATKLHPDKGKDKKPHIVLYHFLFLNVRQPREMSCLNHIALLEPVDPSRKIELLRKKGLVYSNDQVPPFPNTRKLLDLCKSDDADSTSSDTSLPHSPVDSKNPKEKNLGSFRSESSPVSPHPEEQPDHLAKDSQGRVPTEGLKTRSIASFSPGLETEPVPDQGLLSQQGGREQSLGGQPPLKKQGTPTDQPRKESEQPSDSFASASPAQLLGGITTTEPFSIRVIGSPQSKQSSVSGPSPQEQVRKEGNPTKGEVNQMMSELSVLKVGDRISFTSKESGKERKGVVAALPAADRPGMWKIRKIGEQKSGAYNLLGYCWEILKRDESQPETAKTVMQNIEAKKKTDSVDSASAPDAMSIEASESVIVSQKQDEEQEQPTDASPAAPSTSGVEDSTTEIGTVEAMSSVVSSRTNGSRAEENRPEELEEATPGRSDDGSCASAHTDQFQESIWDQAKEVLVQRKLPKIVELFLGLVNGDGKKFYLTTEQVGVIDSVHFLIDSRKKCKRVGNFQYDSSASLQEMFSMCYFLTGEGCLLEMYQEVLIDEKTVEDGFFNDQDNEKFKEYSDKMKKTIMSLSIMLCPGISRNKIPNQLSYTTGLETKKNNVEYMLSDFFGIGNQKNAGDKLSKAFGIGKQFFQSSVRSDSKEGTKGYVEFDPNKAGMDLLFGVEHLSSYLVDFLLMPRAVCSSLVDNVCVTEAVGCVDTNHRKVNTAAMKEKESGQSSLRETWNCNDKCNGLFTGGGSTERTSALFERKCNKVFDLSQSKKVNDRGGDLSVRQGKVHLEGCMHFQKRKCQEVVGPSLLEAATLLLATLGSSVVDSDMELLDFVEKEDVNDEKKVAVLTGTVVFVLSRLVSDWEKRKGVVDLLVGLFVMLQEGFVGNVCEEGEERGLNIGSFVEVLNGIRNVLQCRTLMVTSSIEGAKRDRLAVEELLGLNEYDDNDSFCKEMWTEKEEDSNCHPSRLRFLTKQKKGFFDVPLFSAETSGYLEKYVLCCKKKSERLTVSQNYVQKVPTYSKFGDFYGRLPPSMYCDGFRKLVYDVMERAEGNVVKAVEIMQKDASLGSSKRKKKGKDCLAKHVVNALHAGSCGPPDFIEDGMRTLYQVLHGSTCSASIFLQLGLSSDGILGVDQFLKSKDALMGRMFTPPRGRNSDSKGSYRPIRTGKKENSIFYVESLLRSVWENVHYPDDARLMKSIFDLNGAGARTVWTPEAMENMTDKEKDQSTTIFGTLRNAWPVFPRTLFLLFHSAGDTLKNWYPLDAVVGKTKPKAHNRLLSCVGYKLNRQFMEFVHDNGIWLCLDKSMEDFFGLLYRVCSKRFHEKMPFYVTPSGSFVNVHMPLVILLGLVKEGIVVMRTEGYDLLSKRANKKGPAYGEFEFLMHGLVEEEDGNKGKNEEFLRGMIESGIDSCDLLQKLVPRFSFNLDNARLQEAFIRELGHRNRVNIGDEGGERAKFRRVDVGGDGSLEEVPLVEDCVDVQKYGLKCIGEVLELNKNAPELKEMLNLICRGCLDSSCKDKPEYWSLVALMSRYFDHSFPNVEEGMDVYTDEDRFVLYAHLLREFEDTCLYQKFNYTTPNVFDIIDSLNSSSSFQPEIPQMNAFGSKGGVQKRKGEEDLFRKRLEEEMVNRNGVPNEDEFGFEVDDSEGPSMYIEDEACEVLLEEDRESRKDVDGRRECSGNSRKWSQRIMDIPLTEMDAVEKHFYKVGFNRYKKAYEAGCRVSLLEKECGDEEKEMFCWPLSDWEHVQKRFVVENDNLRKYYGLGVKEKDSSVPGGGGSAPKSPENPGSPVRKSGRKRKSTLPCLGSAEKNAKKNKKHNARRKARRKPIVESEEDEPPGSSESGEEDPNKEEGGEEEESTKEDPDNKEGEGTEDEEEDDDEDEDDDKCQKNALKSRILKVRERSLKSRKEESKDEFPTPGEPDEETSKAGDDDKGNKVGEGKKGEGEAKEEEEEEPPKAPSGEETSQAGDGKEGRKDESNNEDDQGCPPFDDDDDSSFGIFESDVSDGERNDKGKIILFLPRGIQDEACEYRDRDFSKFCALVEKMMKEEVEKEMSLLIGSLYTGENFNTEQHIEVRRFYCYLRFRQDFIDNPSSDPHLTTEKEDAYKYEFDRISADGSLCRTVMRRRERIKLKGGDETNLDRGKLRLYLPSVFEDNCSEYFERKFDHLTFKVANMSWEDCVSELQLAREYSFVYGLEELSKNESFQCFYSNLEKRHVYFSRAGENSDIPYGNQATDEFRIEYQNFVLASQRYRDICRLILSFSRDGNIYEGESVKEDLFPFRTEFVGKRVDTGEGISSEVAREVTEGRNGSSSVVHSVSGNREVDSEMPEPILLLPRGFSENGCLYSEQDFSKLCDLVAEGSKEGVQKELSVLVEYCYKGSMGMLIDNSEFVRFHSYLRIRKDVFENDSVESLPHKGVCSMENADLFRDDLVRLVDDGKSCRFFMRKRDEEIEDSLEKGVITGRFFYQARGGGLSDDWQNYTDRKFDNLSLEIPSLSLDDCLQEVRLFTEYSYVSGVEELSKKEGLQVFYSNLINRISDLTSDDGESSFDYGIMAMNELASEFEKVVASFGRYRELCFSMKEAAKVDFDMGGRSLAECVFPAKLEFVEGTSSSSGTGRSLEEFLESKSSSNGVGRKADGSCLPVIASDNVRKPTATLESAESGVVKMSHAAGVVTQEERAHDPESPKERHKTCFSSNGVGRKADGSCLPTTAADGVIEPAATLESPDKGGVKMSDAAVVVTQEEKAHDPKSAKEGQKTHFVPAESSVSVGVKHRRGVFGDSGGRTPSSVAIVGNGEGSQEDNMFVDFLGKTHGSVITRFGGIGNELVTVEKEQRMQELFVKKFSNPESSRFLKTKFKGIFEEFCLVKKKAEEAARKVFVNCLSTSSEDVVAPEEDDSVAKKEEDYVNLVTELLKK